MVVITSKQKAQRGASAGAQPSDSTNGYAGVGVARVYPSQRVEKGAALAPASWAHPFELSLGRAPALVPVLHGVLP